MHNVWLIARREYIERVRTRGFLITTIMIPTIMAGFIFGGVYLGSRESVERQIVVVSSDRQLADDLQAEMQRVPHGDNDSSQSQNQTSQISLRPAARQPRFTVEVMEPSPGLRRLLDRDLDDNQIDGYLWITPATLPGGQPAISYTPRSSSDGAVRTALDAALNRVLLREELAHRGIVSREVDAILQPVQLGSSHESLHHDRASSMISIGILFFVMYFVIMLYGMNVARSIIEEKTSRIFEVLLAAIRPEEMMAGKIIGVGSVGLTQVGIWLTAVLLVAGSSASVNLGGESLHASLTAAQVGYFFVYFLLGYLFYSSIAAALGAMTNSEQELQQLNIFLMLPLIFCFVALGTMLSTPDGVTARVLALIPPFTPLLMYMRVSLGHPHPWEIALSIALMVASIAAIVWVTSRIYRIGVLMYGKRPTPAELMRWLKYS